MHIAYADSPELNERLGSVKASSDRETNPSGSAYQLRNAVPARNVGFHPSRDDLVAETTKGGSVKHTRVLIIVLVKPRSGCTRTHWGCVAIGTKVHWDGFPGIPGDLIDEWRNSTQSS